MNELTTRQKAEEAKKRAEALLTELDRIEEQERAEQQSLSRAADFVTREGAADIEKPDFLAFFKRPYALIPQGKNKVLVAVPKFVKGFQVGWLWKETETFYIYQFDQYSAWLGDAPADLLEAINFKKGFEVQVFDDIVHFAPNQREAVKKKLGQHLRDVGEDSARILRGHAFDVLAETIENGCLPFRAQPVADADRRPVQHKFNLRPYQAEAAKRFLETGAIGAFHPTGAGKSFLAMHLIDTLKGEKHIIVPTRTLIEQWQAYIETHLPHIRHEVRLFTYSGYREHGKPMLTVYDECHRLPADTFSRLALIPTKYRLGLSASPHREDGRESYIFALTGFPVGLNWQEYMQTAGKSYHPIYIHIVRSAAAKIRKVEELRDPKKKTVIFSDGIELGKELSRRFDVPFVYGETENRLATIGDAKTVVLSRVGDLGVSIKDLQRIIEVDFLKGSRQQELQRTGRLMHSERAERHDIIMTEGEAHEHGKRLWALQEKGFTIKVVV
jgi:DNA excision repair protein ERCC-3